MKDYTVIYLDKCGEVVYTFIITDCPSLEEASDTVAATLKAYKHDWSEVKSFTLTETNLYQL